MTNSLQGVDREVDVRGLHCPHPLLAAKKALATMKSGERLRVLATDANAARDFRLFAEASGNALIHHGEQADCLEFIFRRR